MQEPSDHMLGDEDELLRACRRAEPEAWDALIERYGRLVYATAHRAGARGEAADDVFQSVFQALVQAIDGIRDAQALAAWFITTTKRQAWRLHRTAARGEGAIQEPIEAAADDRAHAPEPGELEEAERRRTVREALAELGPPCDALLRALFGPAPTPYREVSALLGIAEGSIGPTRQRCLAKLATVLDRRGLLSDFAGG